jgi:hypothetical protein
MRVTAVVMAAGLLALAGCDSGDDTGSDVTSEATSAATTEATEPQSTIADEGSSATTSIPDAGTEGGGAEEPGDQPQMAETDGSCQVTVTGDKQTGWTAGGTVGDVASSYWFDDADREVMGEEFVLILNCGDGSGDSLSLVAGPSANEATVPFGPGTYELTSDGAMMGADLIGALLVLEDSATNWAVAADGGTLTIERFDDDGIVGSFSVTMEDSLAAISGEPSEGTIQVTGSFDFVNPRG